MQATTIATPAAAAQQQGKHDSQKLVKSAHEFEAMLLQDWLEKMNESFTGGEKSPDAAHDTISSLASQAIAQALAARGGVGIGRMILRQLQPGQARAPQPPQLSSTHAGSSSAEENNQRNIKVSSPIADH